MDGEETEDEAAGLPKNGLHFSQTNKKEMDEMNNCRLNEDELLDKSHLPVLMIMNMIDENRFLTVLEAISKGNGFGEEYGACTLPDDLDEFDKANGEQQLEGVEFGLYNGEEVVIDFQTFYYYLKIICDKYIKKNFEQANNVNGLLEDYSKKFLVKNS